MRALNTPNELRSVFSKIDDPRSDINKLHKLEDILLIVIISVICAVDAFELQVVDYLLIPISFERLSFVEIKGKKLPVGRNYKPLLNNLIKNK